MLGLLEQLGKEKRYAIRKEKLRVDMAWSRDSRDLVAIEHENEGGKVSGLLDDEVENLLSVACPLLVLVTYFDRSEFDKNLDELDELKEQAKQKMFQKRRFDAEFLLVAGDCDTYARPEDQFWAAYILYPSISATPFLCPLGPWEVE